MSTRVLMLSRSTLLSGPGGDTVQMQETAAALAQLGWQVDIAAAGAAIALDRYSLLHVFGLIRPADLLPYVRRFSGPVLLSPVFMDYSHYERTHRTGLVSRLMQALPPDGQEYVKVLGRRVINGERIGAADYYWRGHAASVRELIARCHLLLPNSANEQRRVIARYGIVRPYRVVPNGVDAERIREAAATPTTAYSDAVVCAARIEGNKNQLALIRALKGTGLRLVLTGQPAPNHLGYAAACRAEAESPPRSSVEFLGRLPQHLDVLRILAAAQVHVLPSHFETCGLSSLEAVALGTRIVVGDRGDVRDYFGPNAVYCDPDREESIRAAVLTAYNSPAPPDFAQHVLTHYTWQRAGAVTAEAYAQALAGQFESPLTA